MVKTEHGEKLSYEVDIAEYNGGGGRSEWKPLELEDWA